MGNCPRGSPQDQGRRSRLFRPTRLKKHQALKRVPRPVFKGCVARHPCPKTLCPPAAPFVLWGGFYVGSAWQRALPSRTSCHATNLKRPVLLMARQVFFLTMYSKHGAYELRVTKGPIYESLVVIFLSRPSMAANSLCMVRLLFATGAKLAAHSPRSRRTSWLEFDTFSQPSALITRDATFARAGLNRSISRETRPVNYSVWREPAGKGARNVPWRKFSAAFGRRMAAGVGLCG